MNPGPGPVEEAGKVAVSVIDSLKSQPIVLALVVFNVLFIGAVVWWGSQQRRFVHDETAAMVQMQSKMAEMIYNCGKPSKTHLGDDDPALRGDE